MFGRWSFNHGRYFRVTLAARVVGDLLIARRDLDGVGIIAAREIERVPETVLRLGGILTNEIRGRVTIIAGRHAAMARLDPAIVLFLHDVTVHASLGIVGEIRRALRVDERVSAHPEREAQSSAQNDASDGRTFHRPGNLQRDNKPRTPNLKRFDLNQARASEPVAAYRWVKRGSEIDRTICGGRRRRWNPRAR